MNEAKPELDAIRKALLDKPRLGHVFDIAAILGVPGPKPVRIRRAKKKEVDLALVAAHAYVARMVKQTPDAAQDPDLLQDAKIAFILASTIRREENGGLMPVWDVGDQIVDELEPDVIAALVHLVNDVREREAPGFSVLDDASIESLAEESADAASAEFPEAHLATYSHGFLSRLVVNMALKLRTARTHLLIMAASPSPAQEPTPDAVG